ncbi:hypothetical protein BH23PLA1_BH23PLA1_23730 [soil metagenome]
MSTGPRTEWGRDAVSRIDSLTDSVNTVTGSVNAMRDQVSLVWAANRGLALAFAVFGPLMVTGSAWLIWNTATVAQKVEHHTDVIGEMRFEVKGLHDDVSDLRVEVKGIRADVSDLRTELRQGFAEIKAGMGEGSRGGS